MSYSLNEIIECVQDREQFYSSMHSNFATVDEYYNGVYKIRKLKGVDAYKPSTAKRKVDYATDLCLTIGRRVIVPESSQSKAALDTNGVLTRWGQAFIDHETMQTPLRDSFKHGNTYGMYCLQGPMFFDSDWPERPNTFGLRGEKLKQAEDDYEDRRARAWPFKVWALNPQCALPDPSGNGPFVKKLRRKAGIIRKVYPNVGKRLDEYKDNDDVEWMEFWTDEEYCYLAGGVPVLPGEIAENWLGYIPFEVGYSGLGFESADGDPAAKAVGLIYHNIDMFKGEGRLKTALMGIVETLSVGGRKRVVKPPGPDYQEGNIHETSVIPTEYGYTVDTPPQVGADIYNVIRMVGEDIDKQTYSGVMEGRNPIGAAPTSGYDRALMTSQDRINLAGLVASMEGSLSNIVKHAGVLVRDVIKEPVTVYGYQTNSTVNETVKPSYFDNNPLFKVKIDGKSPEEIDQRVSIGLELWQKGAISWETFTKEYRGADVAQERNRILIEKAINNNPEIQAVLADNAIKAFGLDDAMAKIKEAGRLQEQANRSKQNGMDWATPRPQLGNKMQKMGAMGNPMPLNSAIEQEVSPV